MDVPVDVKQIINIYIYANDRKYNTCINVDCTSIRIDIMDILSYCRV